nr:hypothetical protein [uncultured Rhodopila sp.]
MPKYPEWKSSDRFKAVLANDLKPNRRSIVAVQSRGKNKAFMAVLAGLREVCTDLSSRAETPERLAESRVYPRSGWQQCAGEAEKLLCDLKISVSSAQKSGGSTSTCNTLRPRSLLKQSRLPEAGLPPNYAGSCRVAGNFNAYGMPIPGHRRGMLRRHDVVAFRGQALTNNQRHKSQ